jgi:acetyltransferase-like isoleucine patch superfamily enzyme
MATDKPMNIQPLQTKGGITIDDDVWLGFGVVVLDGVRIGRGAVIGAGSVVTKDVPEGAIAAGIPARVIKMRGDTEKIENSERQ